MLHVIRATPPHTRSQPKTFLKTKYENQTVGRFIRAPTNRCSFHGNTQVSKVSNNSIPKKVVKSLRAFPLQSILKIHIQIKLIRSPNSQPQIPSQVPIFQTTQKLTSDQLLCLMRLAYLSLEEEPDWSHIYSLLPNNFHDPMNGSSSGGRGSVRKHRRKGNGVIGDDKDAAASTSPERGRKKEHKGIFTSLLLLEEQEEEEEREGEAAAREERRVFEINHRRKTKAMVDYYSNLEDYYTEVEEIDRVRRKKSRASAGAIAGAVACGEVVERRGKKGGGGDSGSGESGPHRRLWVKDRSKAWWDECNGPEFPEEMFKKAFRMGKSTFDKICVELNSVIAKEDTTLRSAIPVRQRVAVCIWRLATGEPLRLVSKRFGLGISTCHKLVLEVCSAIRTVLMPKYLQWPDEDSIRTVKDEYESISGIPNIVGSMYTTHIPIIAPKINVALFFNKRHTERKQKTSYSITLQGVVDPKGVFTDACIGWPGSMTDDAVLEKSALFQLASGDLLKGVWIVGNSGYPLLDWVLVPYTQPHLTWTQHAFNEKIREVQKVARDAFVRLKGRWSCLQKRTEVKLQDLPVVLGACCVLHNICEMRGEEMEEELKVELVDDDRIPETALRSATSMKARDSIAHNLLHHGLAGTAFL